MASGDFDRTLRILMVEDVPHDVELTSRVLERAGIAFERRVVEDAESFVRALADFQPDAILSDYSMPRFDGLTALNLAQEHHPHVPFIMVTGSINEETAVGCLKAGADDYILKEHPQRLPSALRIALETRRQRAARRTAEARLRLQGVALEAAADGILILDREGRIEWANREFLRMTSCALEEAMGKTLRFFSSGLQTEEYFDRLQRQVQSEQVWRGELYLRGRDGGVFPAALTLAPVRSEDGQISHLVALLQDRSESRKREEELRRLVSVDPLTGLPNRVAFRERLNEAHLIARAGKPSALVLFDLDDFQVINEALGHAEGDLVLTIVAQTLQSAVPPESVLSRLGGDEFAVLLRTSSVDEAESTANDLRERISALRFEAKGQAFDLAVSGGLSWIDGQADSQSILANADAALFAAKEAGRNRVVLDREAAPRIRRASELSNWAAKVRDGLRSDRFILHFQPVIRLSDESSEHYEALVRLREVDGEIASPGSFLPAVDRFGLSALLDRRVVELCLAELTERPALRLFVNLSGRSLHETELLNWLESRLRESSVANRIVFEITETTAVGDLQTVRTWIHRLKELGSSFALDDFGTGFSTFAYLRTLPVDFVKIDGSFVRAMDQDQASYALVQAIADVAHALGRTVIAESVERREIVPLLKRCKIQYAQGFLWARPAPLPVASLA